METFLGQFVTGGPTFWATLSAIIVAFSYIPYGIRVAQGKVIPNLVSWGVFTLMGIAFLLTYDASGAGINILPAYVGLFGPLIVFIISLFKVKIEKIKRNDWIMGGLACLSLTLWFFTKENPNYAQFALYIAIFADIFGIIPTIKWVKREPTADRPFLWIVFGFGYALNMLAIEDHTLSNWALPISMFILPALVWWHLVKYRIKNNIPLKDWV